MEQAHQAPGLRAGAAVLRSIGYGSPLQARRCLVGWAHHSMRPGSNHSRRPS
jgi:hypothetical protein